MALRRSGLALAQLWLAWTLLAGGVESCGPATPVYAQSAPATTMVTDTVYTATGAGASGTVLISWPAFSTWAGDSVAAGSTSVTIGTGGSLSVNLVANAGSTPMGSYYTVIYHLSDGSVTREYWVVPVSQVAVSASAIRSSVLPASVAMQTVSKGYVDAAIAAAVTGTPEDSSPYVQKSGDTMTGALVLPGDPTAPLQASDKNYVDEQVAALTSGLGQKVSLAPTGAQTVTQPAGTELAVNNLNGTLDASQYVSGTGNNGIANATASANCASGCQVTVEQSYPAVEVPAPTTWNGQTVLDDRRGGTSTRSYYNPLPLQGGGNNSAETIAITSTESAQTTAALTDSSGMVSYGLNIDSEALTGGSNVYPVLIQGTLPYSKSTFGALSLNGQNNTLGQHILFSEAQNCYGVGDCLMGSMYMQASGGFRDDADEGSHPFDRVFSEDARVFTGTCSSGCTTGSTTVQIAPTSAVGTQGEGRYLIDTNPAKAMTTGTLTGGNPSGGRQPEASFAGTSFPVSVFLETAQTIPTQSDSINPGTVSVAIVTSGVPAGFASSTAALPAPSGVACVSDVQNPGDQRPLNFETAAYTAIDGSHLRMTLYRPHAGGATVAVGGLCGYGLEQKVDTLNGIRQVFPVIGSDTSTSLLYAGGYSALIGTQGETSAYANIDLAVASIARSGGVTTVTSAVNLPVDLNGLTLTVANVADPSYNGDFAVTTTGPNTFTYANSGPDSTSTGGTAALVTGSFGLYPMAEVQGVFNAATRAVDGQMTLAANTVNWATGDTVEQPHYFQESVSEDTDFVTQYTPRASRQSVAGVSYGGNNGPGLTGWVITNGDPASSYFGNGGTHAPPSAGMQVAGIWNHALELQAGESTAFQVHCNSHGCGRWNSAYDLFDLDARTGEDRVRYDPSTSTLTAVLNGTDYTFSPAALTADTIDVTTLNAGSVHGLFEGSVAAASLPVFGASGSAHVLGAVPDPGATAGITRFLREDGTWAPADSGSGYTGLWNGGTSYTAGQLVTYTDGNAYVSLTNANVGNRPATSGTQWGVFAAKGNTGANGVASLPQLSSLLASYPLNGNVLDPAKVQTGYYLNLGGGSLGGGGTYSTLAVTGTMPANAGGSMITATALPALGGNDSVSFFDQNGTYLSGLSTTLAAGGTFSCPSGAASVRLTLNAPDVGAAMVFFGTSLPSSYVAGGAPYATNVVDAKLAATQAAAIAASASVALALQPAGSNFFDRTQIQTGGVLQSGLFGTTIGAFDTGPGAPYYASGYLPVLPGATYNLRVPYTPGNPAFGMVWYNASKTPIAAIPLPYPSPQNFTAPAGAVFARFSDLLANAPTQMWTIGSAPPSTYVSFPQLPAAVTEASISATNGCRIAWFGDSITALYGNNFQPVVLQRTGCTTVFQDARAGRSSPQIFEDYSYSPTGVLTATVTNPDGSGTTYNTSQFNMGGTVGNTLAQDMAALQPDVAIIEMGTNDQNKTLGSLTDPCVWIYSAYPNSGPGSANSQSGCIYGMIAGIQAARPQMQIFFVTPYMQSEGNFAASTQVVQVITAAAGQFAAPVIDMLSNSGISYISEGQPFSSTGTLTGGSSTVVIAGSMTGIHAGLTVEDTEDFIPAATTVTAVSGSSITLSAAPTSSTSAGGAVLSFSGSHLYTVDGLHPNALGGARIGAIIAEAIKANR